MTPIYDLNSYVTPYAMSASDPLVERNLVLAAIELCKRTRCWRWVQEISVSTDEYELLPCPSQASIFEIEEAWFKLNGAYEYQTNQLRRVSFDEVSPSSWPGSSAQSNDGVIPDAICQVRHNSVAVLPPCVGTLKISLFLKPSQDADAIPNFMFDEFAETLARGALSRILMIPDQPYTNPQLASLKAAEFNADCDRYFARNKRGQQRGHVRARSSFF